MRFLTFILGIGLFIIMPFAFSSKLQDVEQSPRFLLLALTVAIAAISVTGYLYQNRNKSITIPNDKFHLVILSLVGITFVGWLRSINNGDGLFELLKILLFVSLYFIFLMAPGNDQKARTLLYRIITLSILLFIGLGFMQFLPQIRETLATGKAIKIDYSIMSSLGNKNFFAEMLLLMLPFSVLSFMDGNKFWKGLALISIVLVPVIIVLLQTLSTWVALLSATMMVGLMIILKRRIFFRNESRKKNVFFISGGILITGLIAVMVFFALTDTTNISKRFSDFKEIITTTKEDDNAMERSSFRERIIMWDNALKVASDYPVSGVGLANLKIIAPEYGLGTAYHIAEGTIVYTHPHNEFLFVLGETGIIGLLIYLTLFVTLFYYSWKLSARAETFRDLIRAGSYLFLIVSFMVIAAVSLPSTRFYPTILLMLAAAMLVQNQRKEGGSTGNTGISLLKKRSLLTFGGLIICVSIYAIPLGITRLKSDFTVSEALIQERQRNFEVMKRHLLKVDREAYPVDVTGTPIAWYLGYTEFYLGNLEKAFEYFTEAEKANRNHLMLLNDLGTCYNLKGDPATAEIYYRRALSNQPYFGNALVNLAVLQFNAGQLDSSYQTLMKHKTKISQDHVNVFATIISAKAANYTSDTLIFNKIKHEFRNPYSSADAFRELKSTPGGLPEYLKKL